MFTIYVKDNLSMSNIDFKGNYQEIDEEYYINNGFTRNELADNYKDYELSDFTNNIFDINKYNKRKSLINNQTELDELLEWFDYYDLQVNQYNRCIRLNIPYDKDINELDQQAKINAQRIKELRTKLV